MRNLNVTREQVDTLARLQKIETESARIQKKLKGTVSQTAVQGARLKELDIELEVAQEELAGEQKRYAAIEEEVVELNTRVVKSQEYLRVVTNNKDYQVLRREVDDNTKRVGELEETLIILLDELEGREKKMAEISEAHTAESEKVKSIENEIYNDTVEERETLEGMAREHEDVVKSLPPALLDHYEKLLKTTDRLAVVKVSGGVCYGCFMNLPPQQAIELKKLGGLHHCPRCHRILYFENDD
ncbi:C4-type zinc ribbon domain-containing protein [Desulfoluna sp.]|uniref:zinc ribbon domain-containing protein n=1 Tax=Desulfoluna sp. TaxID=2045199 RepID=UPI00262367B5|nr:C4-type zinc ribbon domain-containing protein [Desulfoluna sp.]